MRFLPSRFAGMPRKFSGPASLPLGLKKSALPSTMLPEISSISVIGAFCAAVVQTLVPRQAFVAVMDTPGFSILIMMLLAVLLNLCSEADAFVAASFRSSLVPLSGQMAFMVLGPMLDIKLILMYLKVFKAPAIAVLASLTFIVVFLSMLTMY